MGRDWSQPPPSPDFGRVTTSHTVQEEGHFTPQSPRRGNGNQNNHRFGRPDSHWLRKRAITGAMIHATTETSVQPRHHRDRNEALEADGYGATHDEDQMRLNLNRHSPDAHSYFNLDRPKILDRWQSGTIPIDVLTEEYHPPPSPKIQPARHPQMQSFNPRNSSPPAIMGDPDNWLLPHPFNHGAGFPAGENSSQGTDGGFGLGSSVRSTSPYSISPSDDPRRGGGARAPVSTGRGTDNSRVMQSPYFSRTRGSHKMFRVGQNRGGIFSQSRSDTRGSPYPDFGGSSEQDHPPRTGSSIAQHSPDPFVTSEPAMYREHQERSSPPDYSTHKHPQNKSDCSGDYRSVRHGSDSSFLSILDHHPTELASFEDLYHPRSGPRSYAQSVISGAWTQTLTPNTSPNGHNRTPTTVREPLGNLDEIPSLTGPGTQRWHQPTPSPDFRSSTKRHSYGQPDSSILSPLAHKTNLPQPVRSTRQPVPHGPDPQWNRDGTESLSFLNLDLDSSSDSDSGDDLDVDRIVHTAPRPHVNDGPNPLSTSGVSDEQDHVVCAISESRSSDVIGLAVINVTMGRVDIIRIVNDDRYQRLIETVWRMPTWPQTFLVLKKVIAEHSKSSLALRLKQEFPGAEVVPLEREHWNESEGLRMIDRYAWRKDIKAVRSDLERNFYASCAFSAVMSYVEDETGVVFRENSLHVKYSQAADTMGLDRSTITSLELLQNVRNAKSTSSTLFGLVNNTLTPQGRRLIRSTLLQPSTNRDVISARHEAVEELSSNEDLFIEARKSLKQLLHIDIERSVPWVTLKSGEPRLALQDGVALIEGRHQVVMASHEELQQAEKDLNHILMIKAYLGGIQAIQETLEVADCSSQLCKWVLERCGSENTAPISALLEGGIEQDAAYSKAPIDIRNNRLWAIKAEPNSVLEQARRLYRDLTNEMHEYVEGLNKVFHEHLSTAPELRLGNDNHYYLRFQWSDVEREVTRHLAAAGNKNAVGVQHWRQRFIGGVEIVNGIRRKKHYDCETIELIQKSSQIQRQADIVTAQSDKSVVELKKFLLDYAESLLNLNEATSVLDMLCSFAHLATTQNYVRPIITDKLVLKAARHPVVEVRKNNFVPNDVYSGDQDARFKVITGGNMSGKSTFIRSIALIQIMAQVGSFVPAQYAALPICDRLFTRLSTEDKPENNLGTFAVEMAEMNVILRQVTKDSLVIIDELGRGTSTKEGLSLALAMSEKLIEKGCRVFFATHFTELARVLNSTRGSKVLNVHVVGESIKHGDIPQITLPHTIASGPVKSEDYGLDLARRFLPERVIKNAEQICRFLRDRNSSKATGPATKAMKQNKLILALPDLLKQANNSTMDDSALASYLKKLQIEFTIRMNMAADDDTMEGDEGENPARTMGHPVLEKPSEEELQEWKKKCDAAERRVMHANMAQSQERKRPASGDERSSYLQKRSKMEDDMESISQPTPINRGSMIEELRREMCTPTTRVDTPSSFTMDGPDSVMEDTSSQPSMPTETVGLGQTQKAVSISSDDSSHDYEMQDADVDVNNGSPSTSEKTDNEHLEEPEQPLERFQPLKKWYARNSQGVESGSAPSAGSRQTSTATACARTRSGTQEFMRGLDESEDN